MGTFGPCGIWSMWDPYSSMWKPRADQMGVWGRSSWQRGPWDILEPYWEHAAYSIGRPIGTLTKGSRVRYVLGILGSLRVLFFRGPKMGPLGPRKASIGSRDRFRFIWIKFQPKWAHLGPNGGPFYFSISQIGSKCGPK